MEGLKIMVNTNNLNYIIKGDLKNLYGFVPDEDQTTTEENKTDWTVMAIAISSERVNSICGNLIEETGFDNLNESQKNLVKRATARMTIYYLHEGMSYLRASVSVSGNGLSSSVSPPSEPDYVLTEVYNLLQQANLHTPRKAINTNISYNNNDFNTVSIFDESDCKVISWGSANKTFLQKKAIIQGENIKIEDVSDTIPKLKISSIGGSTDLTDYYKKTETNELLDKKQSKTDDTLTTIDKTVVGAINENLAGNRRTYEYARDLFKLIDELSNKKQDKLTAGDNITIENNKISFDKNCLPDYFNIIATYQHIDHLDTKYDTIVGAINELNAEIKKLQEK